jgi:hypothetical protein
MQMASNGPAAGVPSVNRTLTGSISFVWIITQAAPEYRRAWAKEFDPFGARDPLRSEDASARRTEWTSRRNAQYQNWRVGLVLSSQ